MQEHDIEWESLELLPCEAAEHFITAVKYLTADLLQKDLGYLRDAIAEAVADPSSSSESLVGLLSAWRKFQAEQWNYGLLLEFCPFAGWALACGPVKVYPILRETMPSERDYTRSKNGQGAMIVQDYGNIEDAIDAIYIVNGGAFPVLGWDGTSPRGRKALRAYCKKMGVNYPLPN